MIDFFVCFFKNITFILMQMCYYLFKNSISNRLESESRFRTHSNNDAAKYSLRFFPLGSSVPHFIFLHCPQAKLKENEMAKSTQKNAIIKKRRRNGFQRPCVCFSSAAEMCPLLHEMDHNCSLRCNCLWFLCLCAKSSLSRLGCSVPSGLFLAECRLQPFVCDRLQKPPQPELPKPGRELRQRWKSETLAKRSMKTQWSFVWLLPAVFPFFVIVQKE